MKINITASKIDKNTGKTRHVEGSVKLKKMSVKQFMALMLKHGWLVTTCYEEK